MRGLEILQQQDFTVGIQFPASTKCLLRQSIRRRCRNVETQKSTVVRLCHTRRGVFVGQHGGASGVQIGVIVRVIEMPVRVDIGFQGRIAQPIERFFQFRPRRQQKRVNHDFPVGPVQHHNVSSRPGKHGEIFRQWLCPDRGGAHLRQHGRETAGWGGCREGITRPSAPPRRSPDSGRAGGHRRGPAGSRTSNEYLPPMRRKNSRRCVRWTSCLQ